MNIDLYPHNEQALKNVHKMFEEEKKTCVIQPTGTGKTYLVLKH